MLDRACWGWFARPSLTRLEASVGASPSRSRLRVWITSTSRRGDLPGFATLIWLAPIGLDWHDGSNARVEFLVGLAGDRRLGGVSPPPVDNVLRALPVLGVTDNRRLSLWVAFALILLGGSVWIISSKRSGCPGLDLGLGGGRPGAVFAGSASVHRSAQAAPASGRCALREGRRGDARADPAVYQARAARQVQATLRFVPRYYGLAAALARPGRASRPPYGGVGVARPWIRSAVVGLTLVDLGGFGLGLNPAIAREDDTAGQPDHRLPARELALDRANSCDWRRVASNVLMRYGLNDVRITTPSSWRGTSLSSKSLYETGGSKAQDQPA